MFNENFIKNSYNFIKLVNMLRGWERKYTPEEYDGVIEKAFKLINSYGLKPGKLSPPFTLPNEQLKQEFIIKFLKAAEYNRYEVISTPKDSNYTTFNFKIKE